MYAEVRVFEDDGRPMMDKPYYVPATDIRVRNDQVQGHSVIHYEFKFTMSKLIPLDSKVIDILEKEREAYERGYEDGQESIERYYAGGRY